MKAGDLLAKIFKIKVGFRFRLGGKKNARNFTRDHRVAGCEQPPDYSRGSTPNVRIWESWHEHSQRSKEKDCT